MGCDGRPVFTDYWLDGKRELITGKDFAEAFTRAGYQKGALTAVDFYVPGDDNRYIWDAKKRNWVSNEPVFSPEEG